MAALHTPNAEIGWKARPFSLPGTDGKTYTLDEVRGPGGVVVMVMCNQSPFVKAVID